MHGDMYNDMLLESFLLDRLIANEVLHFVNNEVSVLLEDVLFFYEHMWMQLND